MISNWVSDIECLQFKDITKKDVFVLEEFKGPVFNKLSNTKAVIVGPQCLSCCLTEGSEIPPGPHPVFTVGMRDLVITISGVDSDIKSKLSTKICWMGGRCENALTGETTHLISATVLSEKYNKARQYGIKVMNVDWVEAVWIESKEKNILGSNSEFDSFGLSVFQNVVMTATALSKQEKKELNKIVSAHGGIMKGEFASEEINVVVLNSNGIGSEKYKVAQEYGIACVFPSWIHESVKKGYALNTKDFVVENKTSSPNRSQLPPMNLDFSTISHLRMSDETCSTTSNDTMSSMRSQKTRSRLCGVTKELAQLVDVIDMKQVKQAGLFLDGCLIYVYGFTATRREKLHRIISRAGGVRYDRPADAVTHAVCGDPSLTPAEIKNTCMPRAIHVTVRWLTESIHAGKTVEETPYLALQSEKSDTSTKREVTTMQSPMSKRNLQLLRTPTRLPPVPLFGDDNKENYKDDEIMQQYLPGNSTMDEPEDTLVQFMQQENITNIDAKNTNGNIENTTKTNDNITKTVNPEKTTEGSLDNSEVLVYEGITFEIQDMDDDAEQIGQRIERAGGILVDREGSYIVVPMNCDKCHVTNKNSEIVTSTWLDDCLSKEQLVPIDYYHRPVKLDSSSKPLEGLVFSLSTYTGIERSFIMEISGLLGALVQTSLYRRTSAIGFKSTHLICPEPTGAKYNGAVAWGLPVVPSQWLLDCAAANKRIDEAPYIVGVYNETLPEESVKNNTSELKHEEENEADEKTDPTVEEATIEAKSVTINSNNTPIRTRSKSSIGAAEMSPASWFIAMARRGGLDSQETPKNTPEKLSEPIRSDDVNSTPPMDNALSTPNIALFSTPSRRRVQAIKRGERPSNPLTTPKNPFTISAETPESPFGATLRPVTGRMSPDSRKKYMKFCDNLSSPAVKDPNEKDLTPLTDLKRKFFSEFKNSKFDGKSQNLRKLDMNDTDTPPQKQRKLTTDSSLSLNASSNLGLQLKHLNSILTGGDNANSPRMMMAKRSLCSPAAKQCIENIDSAVQVGSVESQVDTVTWDDMTETPLPTTENVPTIPESVPVPKMYKFSLSQNVTNSEEIKKIIERLGGTVSESTELDLSTTHLLCFRLSRSEKFLGCLASGKWILHPSFITRSQEAGRFVDEENYEWGNPKATQLEVSSSEEPFAKAVHYWRCRRSESKPLPFASFRIIMHIQEARKGPLVRVLCAGGGKVVDISPPFSGEINATHCLMEERRMGLSPSDIKYLTMKGIPICPPVFMSGILMKSDQSPKL